MDKDFINKDDLIKAFKRWLDVNPDKNAFEEFIGLAVVDACMATSRSQYFKPPRKTAQRLELLLSPHYKTIIKVWLIKRSSKEVNPE